MFGQLFVFSSRTAEPYCLAAIQLLQALCAVLTQEGCPAAMLNLAAIGGSVY
jgi:hypothetical protein